jgi:Tol biopolymer transport system component
VRRPSPAPRATSLLVPAALAALLTAAAASQETRPATQPAAAAAAPRTGQIAFMRGGLVWLWDAATGATTALTDEAEYDRPLAWLAGGSRLLFWKHDAGWNIWAVDPEDRRQVNLTRQTGGDCRSAACSPDGGRIAFMRGHPQGVHVMNTDGSGQRLVAARGHRDAPPSWSRDGRSLVYQDYRPAEAGSGEATRASIRITGVEGGTDRELVEGVDPRWSPDGGRILFTAWTREGHADLFLIEPDGTGLINLTRSAEREWEAVFAPDGRRIAFVAGTEEAERALRVIDADGKNVRTIAPVAGRPEPPTWSPDGAWLAFISADATGSALWVAGLDGTPARKVAGGGAHWPAWRPAGTVAGR